MEEWFGALIFLLAREVVQVRTQLGLSRFLTYFWLCVYQDLALYIYVQIHNSTPVQQNTIYIDLLLAHLF